MRKRIRPRSLIAAATGVTLAVALLTPAPGHAAASESFSVNLASTRGASTGVGSGILYGINQDASLPTDANLLPLGINAFRGGGHASRGWIGDNYTFGSATQADVTEITTQARRLTQPPYHAQYQVILSDVYGADGGQPSNTMWPCDNGNCSNWISFIDATVGALQNSGLKLAYDVWNEPDISAFWVRGINSTQSFQMWDAGVREIRRIAPGALIVGPSMAFTPQQNAGQWNTWLAHVKAAGTAPDEITNHNEGDGDDPVAVAQSLNSALSANGISARPLSSNEFDPQDQQTAGQIAWYLARFDLSGYTNAMLGNWNCCETPNLTGILTGSGSSWQPTGKWWAFRSYADLTGSLVTTSGQVGSTAITAAEDSSAKRAVALLGDDGSFTGTASVTFSGLASQSWLSSGGSVKVVVDRIPDQSPLSAPQVVLSQTMSASSGSITVPFTFQAAHDAFAIYVTPASGSTGGSTGALHAVGAGKCLDDPNSTTTQGTQQQIFTCNGAANQTWTHTSTGTVTVTVGGSTLCLDANAQGTTNGTKVIIWACNGQANQLWNFNSNGTITGAQSGLCLDVTGASTANGALVELWTCNGQSNQQWTLG
jgi:Ricin-type beta-trefoil lectin domain